MNNWHNEYLAEYHRRDIVTEMEQARLEEKAMRGRPYRPGLFQRSMQGLGAWLVATGEELQCRYQTPTSADCAQSSKQSYAH